MGVSGARAPRFLEMDGRVGERAADGSARFGCVKIDARGLEAGPGAADGCVGGGSLKCASTCWLMADSST